MHDLTKALLVRIPGAAGNRVADDDDDGVWDDDDDGVWDPDDDDPDPMAVDPVPEGKHDPDPMAVDPDPEGKDDADPQSAKDEQKQTIIKNIFDQNVDPEKKGKYSVPKTVWFEVLRNITLKDEGKRPRERDHKWIVPVVMNARHKNNAGDEETLYVVKKFLKVLKSGEHSKINNINNKDKVKNQIVEWKRERELSLI